MAFRATTPAARIEVLTTTLTAASSATHNRNALARELGMLVYGTEAYQTTRAAFDQENGRMIALRTRWLREAEQFHKDYSGNADSRRTIAGLLGKFEKAGLKNTAAEFAVPNKTALPKIEF